MTESTDETTKSNLEYIGSIVASIILFGTMALLGAVALGIASLGTIPQAWFIAVVVPLVIMAAIQVFGKDVYQIFKEMQK